MTKYTETSTPWTLCVGDVIRLGRRRYTVQKLSQAHVLMVVLTATRDDGAEREIQIFPQGGVAFRTGQPSALIVDPKRDLPERRGRRAYPWAIRHEGQVEVATK